MKKLVFLLLLIIVFTKTFAQSTSFEQLVNVNTSWQLMQDAPAILKSTKAFAMPEQQLVQFHLQEVEKLLRNRSIANLSAQQKLERAKLLDILHSYCLAGKFPQNTKHQNRQPYFIDDENTYCAVGYLMRQSGADDIARDINKTQNYNYLVDINHPKLMNWINKSGLSLDELALIQPSYGGNHPCYITEIHYNNIGNDINEYIEILNPRLPGYCFNCLHFDSIIFYNKDEIIYKRLAKTQMTQSPLGYTDTISHYTFSSGDTLADAGKIELINTTSFATTNLIFSFIYNTDSIITESFNGSGYWVGFRKAFATVESDNTAVDKSLNFCNYFGYRNATILPATIGTLNSCVVTPVILSSFTNKITESKIELKWQTQTEINSNYFEIERSIDGQSFIGIGKIKAKNLAGTNNYLFVDEKPNYLNHYRLKQIDNDGKVTYSKILFVKMLNASPLKILENPASNVLRVQVSIANEQISTLSLFDLFGKKINTYKAKQGNQEINIQYLPTGKYFLQLQINGGQVYNQQVVVIK